MSGRFRETIPNVLRTNTQLITAAGAPLDLSMLESSEKVISVTVIPPALNSAKIEGIAGDAPFIIPELGFEFGIEFTKGADATLPVLKAVSGDVTVEILVAVERKF